MRVRSILITTVAGFAFIGASATAAHATPKGPGVLSPTPTTVKPDPPKQCCDKIAPKPTTTIPPKGPGDIANPPADPDPDPKPKGPGDIANPQPGPVVDPKPGNGPKGPGDLAPAPKGGGNTDNGGGTGNGSGSDKDYAPADTGGSQVDTSGADSTDTTLAPAAVDTENVDATAQSHHAAHESSSKMPAFLIIFFALLVAGLIGFVATRLRSEDEDVEQI